MGSRLSKIVNNAMLPVVAAATMLAGCARPHNTILDEKGSVAIVKMPTNHVAVVGELTASTTIEVEREDGYWVKGYTRQETRPKEKNPDEAEHKETDTVEMEKYTYVLDPNAVKLRVIIPRSGAKVDTLQAMLR